jgi:hypothetical protein
MRRPLGLLGQEQPLRDAEAMLFVDHDQAEALIGDMRLENRVSPDQYVDASVGKPHQHRLSARPFSRPVRNGHTHADRLALTLQGGMMLAGEDFSRRKHRRLRAGLDGFEHREQSDQRLARSDIALKQAQHRPLLLHVAADLLDHAGLGAR